MKPSLIKYFIYMIIFFATSIAHSDNNDSKDCQSNFTPDNTRIEKLKTVMLGSIEDTALKNTLTEKTVLYAHAALKDFIDFLDPITLELKNVPVKKIGEKYTFAHLRKSFLNQETLESEVIEAITPQLFIKEFLSAQDQKAKNLPSRKIEFVENYVNHLSFRREVYKFEIFIILFGGIFSNLSQKQVSALVSSKWENFFKSYAKEIFGHEKRNSRESLQEWRHQLQYFIILNNKKPTTSSMNNKDFRE